MRFEDRSLPSASDREEQKTQIRQQGCAAHVFGIELPLQGKNVFAIEVWHELGWNLAKE